MAVKSAYFTDLAIMLGLEVSRFKKDIFYVNSEYSRPGLSNKRLDCGLSLRSNHNLTLLVR